MTERELKAREIKEDIQKEYSKFMATPFPDLLPSWYLKKFPRVFMSLPQATQPFHGARIEELIAKELRDLNIYEVGSMANMYVAAAPRSFFWLFPSIHKYSKYKRQLDNIIARVNLLTGTEDARLKRKEDALLSNSLNNKSNKPMKSI